MIQLITTHKSSRIQYISTFLSERLGVGVQLTDKPSEDCKCTIFYTKQPEKAYFNIPSSGYLESKEIAPKIELNDKGDVLVNQVKDDLAAIFFLLTRAEEYIIKERDSHGRFQGKSSFFPKQFYLSPYVDKVIHDLKKSLTDFYQLERHFFLNRETEIIPTFDIDVAWAYGKRSVFRSLGSRFKDFVANNKTRTEERGQVHKNEVKDPYDTYDEIKQLCKEYQVHLFFLLGDYGKYDKNINYRHPELKNLIARFSDVSQVGIHPSYKADKMTQLKKEIKRLEYVTGQPIQRSRHHFLRLNLPDTYKQLEAAGILCDYTMGFSDIPGFRAGTSLPYKFYNLESEKSTNIKVYPFAYMDSTLKDYEKLNPEEAITLIEKMYENVKMVNGNFAFIWHNHTIGDHGVWKGWKKVFEHNFIKK